MENRLCISCEIKRAKYWTVRHKNISALCRHCLKKRKDLKHYFITFYKYEKAKLYLIEKALFEDQK